MLQIDPSPDGLSRLRLGPEDLAALRPDLADLRIVDARSLQWPYLVERGDGAIEIPLAAEASSKDRATTYGLSSVVYPMTVNRVAVDTDAAYFDRAFRLYGAGADDKATEIVLAQGRFARANGDPMPVTIDFPTARIARLALKIEDGDDAPLRLKSIRARVPVPDIFVAAPAGSYTLLLGAEASDAPSYELEHVRDVVLAVGAAEMKPQPIERNPGYRVSSRLAQGKGRDQVLLWSALLAAVVVLLALTLRLARNAPAA